MRNSRTHDVFKKGTSYAYSQQNLLISTWTICVYVYFITCTSQYNDVIKLLVNCRIDVGKERIGKCIRI